MNTKTGKIYDDVEDAAKAAIRGEPLVNVSPRVATILRAERNHRLNELRAARNKKAKNKKRNKIAERSRRANRKR